MSRTAYMGAWMKRVRVSIENFGKQIPVGTIYGDGEQDYRFRYDRGYLQREDAAAISLRLPLQEKPFDPAATQIFFDGLLPEGFTRRAVAESMHESDSDYLTILAGLGRECIGAIRIQGEEEDDSVVPSYERLTLDQVRALAREGASLSAEIVTKAHISLTGATGKAGVYLDEKSGDWYLPVGTAPSTHIVKQSHVRLRSIVANEQLTQLTASGLGIDVPDSRIINLGQGGDEDVLLATRRYDRDFAGSSVRVDGLPVPCRLHQEDFAQALGISARNKYEKEDQGENGYLPRMFSLIRERFRDPLRDQLKLWDRAVFCYLTGNTDSHLKNFSALYSRDLGAVSLAPAYDLVSTAIYENSTREMSFCIGGQLTLDEIDRSSFYREARYCRINPAMAMRRFDAMADSFERVLREASCQLSNEGMPHMDRIAERILEKGGYGRIAQG